MDRLDRYKVDLKSMLSDTVSCSWHVDDDFFSAVQGPEIQYGQLDVELRVKQTSGVYELTFHLNGQVKVTCDRCMELMDQPIEAEHQLRVKLGEDFDDDGEMVTVPENDGTIDVAWYIYEFAALEIPLRHVHPEGECTGEVDWQWKDQDTDPRWDALKQILDNN